ncbi:MAG: protein kinase [Myxococcaceae bacterium]|nr:protein kinase [Myxococcaceae bacterium]
MTERTSPSERTDLSALLGEPERSKAAAVDRTTLIVPFPEPAPGRPDSRNRTSERKALSAAEPPERRASAKSAPTPTPASQASEDQAPQDEDILPTTRINLAGPLPQAERPPRIPPDERTVLVQLSAVTPAAAPPVDEGVTGRGTPEAVDEVVTDRSLPVAQEKAETPSPPPVTASRKALASRRPPAPRQGAGSPEGTNSRSTLPAWSSTLPALAAITEQEDETSPHLSDTNSLQEGRKVGGYQLLRKLGAGSMGTVWLARQLSLDRDVALKILRPSYAEDPQFVYRFTQEAFAAAQLVHHNIVQIYDCGSEKKVHFFSMEYVDAESLQSLVNREGRLDPEVAAGYVLQAARGLKFAHDRGMVHRDIKPENLLLNHNGIVKVADLGLVKRARRAPPRPDSDDAATEEHSSSNPMATGPMESTMGTPAYMSPEQVENSSQVDARADIYSLGCTFYHLLTGRPPFISESLPALMGMHVLEPPVPPEERVRRVPQALSDMVLRMLAKAPEERFQSMGELIRELEGFLGIEGAASFSPREEHANLLERCVQGFNQARWGRRRRRLVLGFLALSALASGLAGWRLSPLVGAAVSAFSATTWMASFIVRGLFQKGTLFLRFRQFIFQAPLLTWLMWLLMLGGAGYGIYHYGLLGHASFLLAGALVCAIGFYVVVDSPVEDERRPFVDEVEQMLRTMRLRGLEESSLRQFVCKYSGEQWEAFYEALFGYDAKLVAREKWGRNDRGFIRKKHSAWREPLIRGMDALEHARQHRRERRQLRMLERKKVKAELGATPAPSA